MSWDKYAICKKCGYYKTAIGDHATVFRQVCDSCGEQLWDTEVIAREVWNGKWYNPFTWFDLKLEKRKV